jgi:hypothetical protein
MRTTVVGDYQEAARSTRTGAMTGSDDERASAAPALSVTGVDAEPVTIDGLTAGGAAFLLFVNEDCPTSAMAMRRLGDPELAAAMEAGSNEDELEEMFEQGWTDGLPVIPPTAE